MLLLCSSICGKMFLGCIDVGIIRVSEKDVTSKVKDKTKNMHWEPLSDKYGYGTPDRVFKFKWGEKVGFAEFKFIKHLPVRKKRIGLKGKQARWLATWKALGGNAYVIVGVGAGKIAIFNDKFKSIAKDGVEACDFVLIGYDEVETYLRQM